MSLLSATNYIVFILYDDMLLIWSLVIIMHFVVKIDSCLVWDVESWIGFVVFDTLLKRVVGFEKY